MGEHWYYRAKLAAVARSLDGAAPRSVLDVGAGYELKTNKRGALVTLAVSAVATLICLPTILKGLF